MITLRRRGAHHDELLLFDDDHWLYEAHWFGNPHRADYTKEDGVLFIYRISDPAQRAWFLELLFAPRHGTLRIEMSMRATKLVNYRLISYQEWQRCCRHPVAYVLEQAL